MARRISKILVSWSARWVGLCGWGILLCTQLSASPPQSYDELLHSRPEDMEHCDIGLMNLLCTQGLAGAEGLDVSADLATLDRWAESVRYQTQRYLPMYQKDPAKFHNMEGFYRMQMLVTVLVQDFKVGYDTALDSPPDNFIPSEKFFANSQPLFIHGLLNSPHLGNCSSMPVLYVAVGRRLGYPLKLVAAKSHLFARWESLEGTFNIEGTNGGMASHPDDYYKTFPRPLTEEDLQMGHYLKSANNVQSLAMFLATRGICLQVNGRLPEAKAAYTRASELVPEFPIYYKFANQKLLNPE